MLQRQTLYEKGQSNTNGEHQQDVNATEGENDLENIAIDLILQAHQKEYTEGEIRKEMQHRKSWCEIAEEESGESDGEVDVDSINTETISNYGEQGSPRNIFQCNMGGSTDIEYVQETQLHTDSDGFQLVLS